MLLLSVCASPSPGAPVRSEERLDVDGARLFLQERGPDRTAPVLLWLHGGPGGAERPLFRYYNGALEDRFLVVYWDQRGAGRSFDPEADPARLTIARHLADLDAVVRHLRRVYAPGAIVLVGHSWGGALALLYASAHPDEVAAVIGVAPLISTSTAKRAEFEFVQAEASRRHDAAGLARLDEIGTPPYETAAQGLALERLSEQYGGVFHRRPSRTWMVVRGVLGGLVTPWEIPGFIRANQISLEAMHEELLHLDLSRSVRRVDVPVIFMLGRYDRHVDAELAASYLDGLECPVKRVVWFEQSAHNVPFEEPNRFNRAVVSELAAIGIGAGESSAP